MKTKPTVLLITGLVLSTVVILLMIPEASSPQAQSEPTVVRQSAPKVAVEAPAPIVAPPVAVAVAVDPAPEAERELFAQAESLLERDPSKTMDLLHAGDVQFPRGGLADERQFLKMRARVNLNQIPEARVDATQYLELNPRSPLAPKIHQLLGIRPPPEIGARP